jgi:hypothetical protein
LRGGEWDYEPRQFRTAEVTVKASHSEDETEKIAGTLSAMKQRGKQDLKLDPIRVNWRIGLFAND